MVILSSESWEIICNLHIVYNDTKVLMLNSLWSLDVNTSSTIYVCLYVVGEFVTFSNTYDCDVCFASSSVTTTPAM